MVPSLWDEQYHVMMEDEFQRQLDEQMDRALQDQLDQQMDIYMDQLLLLNNVDFEESRSEKQFDKNNRNRNNSDSIDRNETVDDGEYKDKNNSIMGEKSQTCYRGTKKYPVADDLNFLSHYLTPSRKIGTKGGHDDTDKSTTATSSTTAVEDINAEIAKIIENFQNTHTHTHTQHNVSSILQFQWSRRGSIIEKHQAVQYVFGMVVELIISTPLIVVAIFGDIDFGEKKGH